MYHGDREYIICKQHRTYSFNKDDTCDDCEIARLIKQRDELIAALIYHQEQTRPIQQTKDILAKIREGKSNGTT